MTKRLVDNHLPFLANPSFLPSSLALPFVGKQSRVNNLLFIRVIHRLRTQKCVEQNVVSIFFHCLCCVELASDKANIGNDVLIVSYFELRQYQPLIALQMCICLL